MAVSPFAVPDDVAGIWRPIRPDETDLVLNLIADASAMILEYPAVIARIDSGALSQETLRWVVKHMVHRVMLNPSGLKQFSATVDDATKSGTYDTTMATGQLTITGSELDRLLGLTPTGLQSGAFTIRPYHEADVVAVDLWS